ncbi:uncharacterized protein At3g50808 [Lotus japonicus]|uniref:uncharacterized protein At3g50808 n=1 Tax=Lotus japonicus TaxID=34305 RepID=UPI00258CE482|nr:uncharacterized protein At3g50808 [Lotus japonicus]
MVVGTANIPSWLQALLDAFRIREPLAHSPNCTWSKKFFTVFCIDCLKLVCKFCQHHQHKEHQVLPLYQASGQDGFKVNELCKLIDIEDIQLYTINAMQIVYVNKRNNKDSKSRNNKTGKEDAPKCEVCGWELIKVGNKFCSIECKAASGRNLSLKSDQSVYQVNSVSVDQVSDDLVESCRKRQRKGMPTRAPFF